MLYFKKESVRNPVFGPDKKAIVFRVTQGELGVIEVDEAKSPELAKVLIEHADNRRGGVVRISQEIFESLKKNEVSKASPPRSSLNQIRVSPSPLSFTERLPVAPPAAAANVGRNAPLTIMDEPPSPSSIAQFRQTGVRSRPVGKQDK